MKSLLLVLITLAAFFSCNSSASNDANNGYQIKGNLKGADGMTIYLDKLSFNQGVPIDTNIIGKDGAFEMKGDIKEKGLYLLRISQDKTWVVILGPGEKIDFNGDFNNLFGYEVKGSAENTSLAGFIKNFGSRSLQMQQISQDFNNARMNNADQQALMSYQLQYQQLGQMINSEIKGYADTVSSPLLAVFAGSLLPMEQEYAYLEALVKKADAKQPNSPFIGEMKNRLAPFTSLSDGKPAPDFEVKGPKGETYKLSQLKGQVVLLDFWASWCRPCRMENPNVVTAYNTYKDKGFTVFSVSLDDNMQAWVQAIGQDNLAWPYHGSELKKWDSAIGRMYNVSSIPTNFLIDKDGKIIGKNLRGEALQQKLASIF
ncbi:MAG: TlpA disulfide reductase family protein [Chitinophagales bacterium]|nr:TlpA disulfide reductase family protein [Chitinophagales bacterium]